MLWLGKTKNSGLFSVSEDLIRRVSRLVPLTVTEIKEARAGEDRARVAVEGERLLAAINASDFLVALDPAGRTYTSTKFAEFLGHHMSGNPNDLTFVVGGHAGLSETVKKRANLLWSLSPLTYSHDLARVMLLEQTYRALTIIHNHPYAK